MKIQLTIPEFAVKDVKEYCRIEEMDLHARMQGELDTLVKNILWYMEERRQINKGIDKTIRELFHAD